MALEIINFQGLYKGISQYIGAIYLFKLKFFICNQLLNIIILNIDMLSASLALKFLVDIILISLLLL